MGCVSSKTDINDQHPNLFEVTNVNENRELVSPGQLEITESELILHQKGRTPLIWPLRTLRKYGFDMEIFTFECGRRCPTGEGIYAFQCKRADKLFNLVQQNISRNISDDTTMINANTDLVAGVGPPMNRRPPTQLHPEGYLTPLSAPNVHTLRSYPAVRPGSVIVTGPLSPPASSETPLEHNNNKRGSLNSNSSFSFTSTNVEPIETQQNVGLESSSSNSESYVDIHVYMNVDTKEILPITKESPAEEDAKHCYANIDAQHVEQLRTIRSNLNNLPQKVNYAKLDFDTKDETATTLNNSNPPPDSPSRPKESYAVIDFYRTNALSQSTNPTIDIEEGVRKTRHNSSIGVTRTSASLGD